MTKALRWGLLSTANINRAIILPLHQSSRSQLQAVASRSEETAQAYAGKWHIPRAHGSYEALLNDPEIDVIYNPLPNHLHAEWTVKALRAGKHVLCEKPLTLSLPEMESILEAAQSTGRIAAEAFMYRHHPKTLQAQRLLADGRIGRPRLLRGTFSSTFSRPDDYRWNPEQGGGALWDIGCYPLSYMRALLGQEPLEVFGWRTDGPTGVDVAFSGLLRFAQDIHAQFDCHFAAAYRTQLEVVGSEGIMTIPNPFVPGSGEEIHLRRSNNDTPEIIRVEDADPYLGEVQDMEACILDGATPRISLQDSLGNLRAILALFESARTGRPVLL